MRGIGTLGLAAVLAIASSAIAQSPSVGVARMAETVERPSTDVGVRYPDPSDLVLAVVCWAFGPASLDDLIANDVTFIGTVIAADAGQYNASPDGPGASDNDRPRWVTVRVDSVLAGDESVESVVLATMGWWLPEGADGRAIPTTPEGVPWLDVGETVFVSGSHDMHAGHDVLVAPAADGVFEIVDGRLVEPFGGVGDSLIWEDIGGLSIDELRTLIGALT